MNKKDDDDNKEIDIENKSVQITKDGKNVALVGNRGDVTTCDIQKVVIEKIEIKTTNQYYITNINESLYTQTPVVHAQAGGNDAQVILQNLAAYWQANRKYVVELGKTQDYFEAIRKYKENSQYISKCLLAVGGG